MSGEFETVFSAMADWAVAKAAARDEAILRNGIKIPKPERLYYRDRALNVLKAGWITYPALMALLGLKRKQVQSAIDGLGERGEIIEKRKTRGAKHESGRFRPHLQVRAK